MSSSLLCCCPFSLLLGFALESLRLSIIYLHFDKTILNNNVCMRLCVRVWAQNAIARWWLWWRIRPPKRCFLHQINLNYNQFRWWLWFEEAAVATATVALFGFSEFLRSLFPIILVCFCFILFCLALLLFGAQQCSIHARKSLALFHRIVDNAYVYFVCNSFCLNDTLFQL